MFSNAQTPIRTLANRYAIIEMFLSVCKRWNVDIGQQMTLLGYSSNNPFVHKILDSDFSELPRDMEDRAGYVVGISLSLSILFGNNEEAELSWLRLPRNKLDGKSAIEYMLEGDYKNLYVISNMVKRERGIY